MGNVPSTICSRDDAVNNSDDDDAVLRRRHDTYGCLSDGSDSDDDEKTSDDDLSNMGGKQAADKDRATKHLVFVALNLPVQISKLEDGKWDVAWDNSKNFLANCRQLEGIEVTYVGLPNVQVNNEERDELETALAEKNCIPVFLPEDLRSRFYDSFCKEFLWPVFHYMLPHDNENWAKEYQDSLKAYNAVNVLFAQTTARAVETPTDSIWIHNYHLCLAPTFVRNKLPRAKIGFFIHTPWPSSDVFRVLPTSDALLRGILCSDLIGFHTFDYVRHFLSCCKRVLQLNFETLAGGRIGVKYAGRMVSIVISHVGINTDHFRAMSADETVLKKESALLERFQGRVIICGVDTLDIVKGSLLKFQAFERFLADFPHWRDKVVLYNILLPDSNEYYRARVHKSIVKQVETIQQAYGEGVIHIQEGYGSLDSTIALYRAAKICMVNSFWDGLNLTPYEFTATQPIDDPGILILSDFMGCSRSLSGAIRVNPWSLTDVSNALNNALSMTLAERVGNHDLRINYVMKRNTKAWALGFIRNLDAAASFVRDLSFVPVGFGSGVRLVGMSSGFKHCKEEDIVARYKDSTRRIILCDYDGTLTSGEKNFGGPPENVVEILENLSKDPATCVFIMSGRTRSFLSQWFGHIEELGLAAEKGCFLRWPARFRKSSDRRRTRKERDSAPSSGAGEWQNLAPTTDDSWKAVAREVMDSYTNHTDGSWVEDKELAIVWHYENADPEFGLVQALELEKYLTQVLPEQVNVVVYDYSRIVEVKPEGVSKASTAIKILQRTLPPPSAAKSKHAKAHKIATPFLLALGDDRSDEDMFKVLQDRLDITTVDQKKDIMQEVRQANTRGKKKERKRVDPFTFTCCVGMKPSEAQYYLTDHEEVHDILRALAGARYNISNAAEPRLRDRFDQPEVYENTAAMQTLRRDMRNLD
mmetsp:Transcript_48722/g.95546  ORF Transcript_48722/g.95546 Transcript_48722/m.95546 type:complete len:929 (+) Transcript_48722:78-2864(+)|eukprot:CAMPEP_0175138170 /NCGR_PEP_ID=MMETSP0087-20121206/10200_1 /TAXON_ID=136419 /ORGANISM="Unknown Unknown, Strain D1" /LENGTH=928 /DNA_ID=CAMNT_0016421043 /DNA_START=78 /DNA_END=2864 /DNA_ORIENTATION=-